MMLGRLGDMPTATNNATFRTRCDGTVNDPYCNQNCATFGPYSSGGRLICPPPALLSTPATLECKPWESPQAMGGGGVQCGVSFLSLFTLPAKLLNIGQHEDMLQITAPLVSAAVWFGLGYLLFGRNH